MLIMNNISKNFSNQNTFVPKTGVTKFIKYPIESNKH